MRGLIRQLFFAVSSLAANVRSLRVLPGLALAAVGFGCMFASTSLAQLPVTSGLKLWLDASQLTGLNDGDTVNTWTDMSGLDHHATKSGGSPTYKTGVLNGQPVIRFVRTNGDAFTTDDLSSQFPSAATVFIVTTINATTPAYTMVCTSAGNPDDEWWRHDSGFSYPAVFRSPRVEQYCPMPDSGSHLFTISSSASAWEMWIDGISQGVKDASYSAGGMHVIGSGSSGQTLEGDIAEVIEYDRALDATELTLVGSYLASKYGLTLTTPPELIDLASATGVFLADTAAGGDGTFAGADWDNANSYYDGGGLGFSVLTDGTSATKWLGCGTEAFGVSYPGPGGDGAGFYFTLPTAAAMQGIKLFTEDSAPARSPATMTIEGSNAGDPMLGTSWTLLYSGPAGLDGIGNNSAGATVNFGNATAYTSYRVLFPTIYGDQGVQLADIAAYAGPGGGVTHTLTYTAGAHGTITGTSPQTVADGANGTEVTAVADSGYHFVSWSDGVLTASRTELAVTADINVTASFRSDTHTLTYTPGLNGTITGTSPQTVADGADGTEVTAVADSGYHFVSWSDGVLTASRTDLAVTADITVTATFLSDTAPTITAIEYHGRDPNFAVSGVDLVNTGSSALTGTTSSQDPPNWGTSVDGAHDGSHTIITATAADQYAVNDGTTLTFDLGGNSTGYDISSIISLTGYCGGPDDRISQKYNVEYRLVGSTDWSLLAGDAGATVNREWVFGGGDAEYAGELQVTISGMGLTGVDGLRFTFYNYAAEAIYQEIDVIGTPTGGGVTLHTLTYTPGPNGTITGTSPQTVADGANGTEVTAVADSGYHFVSWSDGVLTASRTDLAVTADISVTASFASDTGPTITATEYHGGGVHFAVSASDLVNTGSSALTGTTSSQATPNWGTTVNGAHDGIHSQNFPTYDGQYAVNDGSTLTFDLGGNSTGYDISSIISLTGYSDGTDRISQKYDVEYSLVGSPDWLPLAGDTGATVNREWVKGGDSSYAGELQVTISGMGLTGVDGLRFKFYNYNAVAIYQEIDVIGTPTAMPPCTVIIFK